MSPGFSKNRVALAVVAALGVFAMEAAPDAANAANGTYVSGDFHNHTTCSDGSISMQKLVKKSTDKVDTPWGLDWFVQAGHGSSGNRNCTLVEDESLATPAYPLPTFSPPTNANPPPATLSYPNTTWQNTIPAVQPQGDVSGTAPSQNMWRWQAVQQFQYPLIEYLNAYWNKPLFVGVESVVAGHEHTSMSIITGQIPQSLSADDLPTSPPYVPVGNANALSQWNYCFDRGDTDTSRGAGNNWSCANPASPGSTSAELGWSDSAMKLNQPSGTGTGVKGHLKTVEGLKWMVQFDPDTSYYIPAHLERPGPFNPNGNNGFNVESLRDFNNAAPKVAFGFETQPGHHASDARGEYTIRRNNFGSSSAPNYIDSVGGTTYGGTGVYGAQIGGVWDALLGEGRNWWFFASSDWHNRGIFPPDDRRSTQDFYPGEFQRTYVMVLKSSDTPRPGSDTKLRPQAIVDGLRTGNAFSSEGQLIDRLAFVACIGPNAANGRKAADVEALAVNAALKNTVVDTSYCATMGQKLVVPPQAQVIVSIVARDPAGTNYSPYTFDNPSLAQVNIHQPLNKPVLDHIDVIRGAVTSLPKKADDPDYAGAWPNDWIDSYLVGKTPSLDTVPVAAKNPTAKVIKTFDSTGWNTVSGNSEYKVMTFTLGPMVATQYVRLRGSNLPPSVPFETDADGNPLPDLWTNAVAVNYKDSSKAEFPADSFLQIPCNTKGTTQFDGCPDHLGVRDGQKYSSYDVAAWSDLWFYSNPIYIEVEGGIPVVGVKAKDSNGIIGGVAAQ